MRLCSGGGCSLRCDQKQRMRDKGARCLTEPHKQLKQQVGFCVYSQGVRVAKLLWEEVAVALVRTENGGRPTRPDCGSVQGQPRGAGAPLL